MPIADRTGPWWQARRTILERFAQEDLNLDPGHWLLKTDLFDEASGPHHHAPDPSTGVRWLGIDVEPIVARAAAERLDFEAGGSRIVVCDVRALPLADQSLSAVVSLSTLDHFNGVEEIRRAVREFARVLGEQGELRITLDNPANPEVALRAALPRGLVARLRADEFALGVTMGLDELCGVLRAADFKVQRAGYLIHAPRYPTIRLSRWLARLGWGPLVRLVRGLNQYFEVIGRLPTGRWTGHYVAASARRMETDLRRT